MGTSHELILVHGRDPAPLEVAPGSWLNAVETFFSALASTTINRCIADHDDDPKTFTSTGALTPLNASVRQS